ncbi:hypothetical protein M0811_11011 [Anaeramoeba ignava]|uniref:Uncharacterized protein n=1 Tax=Anaeramoeba ignava TaxID=1746090 RepID=A0A9Q0LDB4_ANAIG|nr:hypothetical protein M0811_11011 [Anaeramoeba ignava]
MAYYYRNLDSSEREAVDLLMNLKKAFERSFPISGVSPLRTAIKQNKEEQKAKFTRNENQHLEPQMGCPNLTVTKIPQTSARESNFFTRSKIDKNEIHKVTRHKQHKRSTSMESKGNKESYAEKMTNQIIGETKETAKQKVKRSWEDDFEHNLKNFIKRKPIPGIGLRLDMIAKYRPQYISGWRSDSSTTIHGNAPKKIRISNKLFRFLEKATGQSSKNARRSVSAYFAKLGYTNSSKYHRGRLTFRKV